MSVQSSHAALKQAYINRVLAFRALYLANRDAQDHITTVPEAILLTCDLLNDYKDVGQIAEVFQDVLSVEEFEWGIFGAFMNAVAVEHEHFDRILGEIHLEHTRVNPKQILATNKARMAMMTYYPSRSHVCDDQPRPTLWDANGGIRHNPLHFYTTFGAFADHQLEEMFKANGSAILSVLSSLREMTESVRERIVNALLPSAFEASVAATDPRRLALAPYGKREDQVELIARRLITSLSYEPTSAPFEIEANNFFDTLLPWSSEDRQMAWTGFVAHTLETFKAGSSYVDNPNATNVFTQFLVRAVELGFDATPLVSESLSAESNSLRDLIYSALSHVSFKDEYNPYPSLRSVISTAYLMVTEDQKMIDEGLDRDALFELYAIKKTEVLKEALKTPENADLLLAHELGL